MSIREIKIQVRVFVDRDGEYFHAYVPELRGLHAGGETQQEALEAVREGLSLYVQSLVKHDESIPMGMVVLDREHTNIFTLIGCLVRERFFSRKKSFVEEVIIPTTSQELLVV